MNLNRHPQEADPDGVTVWERKAPEEDPAIDVRLADGLRMPSADKLTNEVDLEDWIREESVRSQGMKRAGGSCSFP